jgi:3-methyladenine DNA glycosylase AlkD
MSDTPRELQRRIRAAANPRDAVFLQRFFRTGPGEYGEGDRFLGIRVPTTRRLIREYRGPGMPAVRLLLNSQFHEERLLALLLLVRTYERAEPAERERIYRFYLANTRRINNWDLVDSSAPQIVGSHLERRSRRDLSRLARSKNLWERRIAVVATQWLIRAGDFEPTLTLAERLLTDPHDLMHKAIGWMLREVGKRDRDVLRGFLDRHAGRMPRTMLRYSLEHFAPRTRRQYMRVRA